jgi:hypothetical protein
METTKETLSKLEAELVTLIDAADSARTKRDDAEAKLALCRKAEYEKREEILRLLNQGLLNQAK